MAKNKYKIRRGRRSKLDAYDTEILEMLEAGMSINGITEALSEYFTDGLDYNAVYAHIQSKGFTVKRKKYTGTAERPPECNTCEKCTVFINFKGTDDIRCCLLHHRMVGNEVKTSPMWCGLR